jgi:Rha family phage regulatory protein
MTRATPIAPELTVVDGHVTTTSLDVARHFGKRHGHVLRTIRDLAAQLPPERQPNFGLTSLEVIGPNGGTRSEPAYRITRDGFTLLAMGFTGARALEFKLAYLDAFNRMEAEVARRALPAPDMPEIDVAALLLSGQSDPVPLAPEQYRLIDQRAYALSADAHALIREHLLRAVAYRTTWRTREEAGNTTIAALLDSITLGHALAHQHYNQVRAAATLMAGARDLIAQAHDRLQVDLKTAGQSAHATH